MLGSAIALVAGGGTSSAGRHRVQIGLFFVGEQPVVAVEHPLLTPLGPDVMLGVLGIREPGAVEQLADRRRSSASLHLLHKVDWQQWNTPLIIPQRSQHTTGEKLMATRLSTPHRAGRRSLPLRPQCVLRRQMGLRAMGQIEPVR